MPLVQLTVRRGRTPEQLHTLIVRVTDVVEESLGARRSAIRVVLTEVEPTHWANGGRTLAELDVERAQEQTQEQ